MKHATPRLSMIVLAALMSLWLVGCGGSANETTDATNSSDSDLSQLDGIDDEPTTDDDWLDEDGGQQPNGACPDATHWSDARELIGREATIVGPVTSASYHPEVPHGHPTFLDIGGDYGDPGIFQVVIWDENRPRFATPPEEEFLHKSICVTGKVTEHNGVPEIEVKTPKQIELND